MVAGAEGNPGYDADPEERDGGDVAHDFGNGGADPAEQILGWELCCKLRMHSLLCSLLLLADCCGWLLVNLPFSSELFRLRLRKCRWCHPSQMLLLPLLHPPLPLLLYQFPQHPLITKHPTLQHPQHLQRPPIRVELLPHQETIKYQIDNSLPVRDTDLPVRKFAENDAQEGPCDEGAEDHEEDELAAGPFDDFVKPAVETPGLGGDGVGIVNNLGDDSDLGFFLISPILAGFFYDNVLRWGCSFSGMSGAWDTKDAEQTVHCADGLLMGSDTTTVLMSFSVAYSLLLFRVRCERVSA